MKATFFVKFDIERLARSNLVEKIENNIKIHATIKINHDLALVTLCQISSKSWQKW